MLTNAELKHVAAQTWDSANAQKEETGSVCVHYGDKDAKTVEGGAKKSMTTTILLSPNCSVRRPGIKQRETINILVYNHNIDQQSGASRYHKLSHDNRTCGALGL